MGLRAYLVEKKFSEEVFNCYEPDEWHDRLMAMGKFDNGMWMEFTDEELDEMEADEANPLSDAEKHIVAVLRAAIAADTPVIACIWSIASVPRRQEG